MSNLNLDALIEAVLFSTHEPLTMAQLATITGADTDAIPGALESLKGRLTGGIRLAHSGDTFRLVTAPEAAPVIQAFLDDTQRQDLTRPALETLAIVAYRGPITKSHIEHIRGVASESMLRNLVARGLVAEAGRSPEPGRPQLYAVSHTFLQHFGLTSTTDLPPLPAEEPAA
ncbi:MAG TPA: SMC-Scp complex subunit ScpB [Candidatus Saccharimonadia bacterium]|nr:SMC-Scp complex subunit ScpB [Candidatus Saccharimonadia bacterium]